MQSLNKKQTQKIIDSEKFFNFISDELKKTVNHSTNEEIAKFAFGSVEEALNEFLINIKVEQ
ncbi:hypothetical protein H8E88_01165 [candidate division KSB1 bacterium]|nr:hypothetical protein [candidate division KSB1 bacterium]